MKITPVIQYAPPRYPDKYAPGLDALLRAHVPLRWRSSPLAGTVLSAVIMLGLSSCAEDYVTMGEPEAYHAATPFFEHGMGVGTFGCVSVAAPVFLSEADAFAIISDEFAKIGFTVEQGGGTVGSVDFDWRIDEPNIVMEFVSRSNYQTWATEDDGILSSVTVENYLESAKTLNDSLNDMNLEQVHGVFYNPGDQRDWDKIDWGAENRDESIGQSEQESMERAAEDLRAQVRDFIEWLGAQGVI